MRIYHWILLRTGNFPNRVREDQNTHFRFIKFCPGMVLFVRWSGKTYDRVRCATVDNIVPWNALCMLYKYGRRQPLIIFYTDCFPWQKWLSERASVWRTLPVCFRNSETVFFFFFELNPSPVYSSNINSASSLCFRPNHPPCNYSGVYVPV